MRQFVRPRISNDDDLEELQREFLATNQKPAATIVRKAPPPAQNETKKTSVFAQRRQAALQQEDKDALASMPALEGVDEASMPNLEWTSEHGYQAANNKAEGATASTLPDNNGVPVDDNMPPHVPVSKKMLDLTSLLGGVLGEIKEHQVDKVEPPSLKQGVTRSQRHEQGFPKPARRSAFKERLEKQRSERANATVATTSTVTNAAVTGATTDAASSDYELENENRIASMSEQEIEEARQEIMSSLSQESIAILMQRKKKTTNQTSPATGAASATTPARATSKSSSNVVDDDQDLLVMKEKYFKDVPLESEKLAWMDSRFETQAMRQNENQQEKKDMTEMDSVYRTTRFDLQGNPIDPVAEIPAHLGLHHHGDDPDKAGYTLAELVYLMRSQVPSQRTMVLTTISRILQHAKQGKTPFWSHMLALFSRSDLGLPLYLRSAMDDRHLAVLVSAIQAMAALVTPAHQAASDVDVVLQDTTSLQYLGHVVHPAVAPKVQKGNLEQKFTATVDALRNEEETQPMETDAEVVARDLVRGLLRTNILIRLRYLLAPESELAESDPPSMERLAQIMLRLAQGGPDVCVAIGEAGLLDHIINWGLHDRTWPMTDDNDRGDYPSLTALRILTTLAQGSKALAQQIHHKVSCVLPFLAVSPELASSGMRRLAYALQVEALKLLTVLVCYGLVTPMLQEVQEPMMGWLRAVLKSTGVDPLDAIRATAAIRLLEVCLHAAADPHKTTPAHAIDWHQATAFWPLLLAVVRSARDNHLLGASLGYMATWASHLDKFPPDAKDSVANVWQSLELLRWNRPDVHIVLRHVQLLVSLASIRRSEYAVIAGQAQACLVSSALVDRMRQVYDSQSVYGRLLLYTWMMRVRDRTTRARLWGQGYDKAELQAVVSSIQAGETEACVAQALVQYSVLDRLGDTLASTLKSFYTVTTEEQDMHVSRGILAHDGRQMETFMYPRAQPEAEHSITGWVLSPIDHLYAAHKSPVTVDPAALPTVLAATLEAAVVLLSDQVLDHDVAVVSLAKLWMVEGNAFWDPQVSSLATTWLDRICQTSMTAAFDNAWRKSLGLTRQQPFFQFYQTFVARYAETSFGHPGFARMLVYLMAEAGEDAIDYQYLLWSDYRDTLPTIKVQCTALPSLASRQPPNGSLTRAILSALLENKVERDAAKGDALYQWGLRQLQSAVDHTTETPKQTLIEFLAKHPVADMP